MLGESLEKSLVIALGNKDDEFSLQAALGAMDYPEFGSYGQFYVESYVKAVCQMERTSLNNPDYRAFMATVQTPEEVRNLVKVFLLGAQVGMEILRERAMADFNGRPESVPFTRESLGVLLRLASNDPLPIGDLY